MTKRKDRGWTLASQDSGVRAQRRSTEREMSADCIEDSEANNARPGE
jgi:hypothetical protein